MDGKAVKSILFITALLLVLTVPAFTIDNTAPTIHLPVYDNITFKVNTSSLTLNISCVDTESGCSSPIFISIGSLSNQTLDFSDGWANGTVSLNGLLDGTYSISIFANDTVGNSATNNSYVVTMDSTLPSNIQWVSPTPTTNNGYYHFSDLILNATFTESNPTYCGFIVEPYYLLNDTLAPQIISNTVPQANNYCYLNYSVSVLPQDTSIYAFYVSITDKAGNVKNNIGFGKQIINDWHAPSPFLNSPTEGFLATHSIEFQIGAFPPAFGGDNSTDCVSIWTNISGTWAITNSSCKPTSNSGYFNWTVNISSIPEGTFLWGVSTNDTAGNTNTSFLENRTFTILTTSPIFNSFSMTDDDLGLSGWQVNPVESANKTISLTVNFSDGDGASDISSISFNVTYNNKEIFIITNSTPVQVDTYIASATVSFPLTYYSTPANYDIFIVANDTGSATGNSTHSFEYTSLSAFVVPTGDISYGALYVGQNSSVENLTVRNTGNLAFYPSFSGTNLSSGTNSLPSTTIWYGATTSQTYQLSNSAVNYTQVVSVFNETAGSNELGLGWKWAVPVGTPAGTYTGTITVQA